MAITFSGGSPLPAVGTAAYSAAQRGSGFGSYNPSTGTLTTSDRTKSFGSGGGGSGVIYNPITGVTATPTANTTDAQRQAALSQGFAPITASSLAPQTSILLPSRPVYRDIGKINNAGLAGISPLGTFDTNALGTSTLTSDLTGTTPSDVSTPESRFGDLKSRLGLIPQKENVLSSPEILAQQSIVQQQRQQVNDYTAQLNQIVSKQNQDLLSLPGQGRGIPEAIIGGQQAQINREAAIRSLPIQSTIAIAQGNLGLAQDYLKTLIEIKTESVNNNYEYKVAVFNSVSDYLTKEENILIDAKKTKETRAWQMETYNLKQMDDMISSARETGQGNIMTAIGRLNHASPTFRQDMATATTGLLPSPASQKIQAELRDGNAGKTPEVKNFGTNDAPIWKQFDRSTKIWNDVSGLTSTSTSNALGNALAIGKIENITNVLNNASLGSAVGPSTLARTNPGLWGAAKRFISGFLAGGVTGAVAGLPFVGVGAIPGAIIGALTVGTVNSLRGTKDELTGDRGNFIGSVEQIRSELTVAKLAQAKGQGVTFGALSDGERGLIANAATKIGSWAMHEDGDREKPVLGYAIDQVAFKKEMDIINYFTKLDAILKGSTPESIGAIVKPDSTIWVVNSDGTLSQIDLTTNRQ